MGARISTRIHAQSLGWYKSQLLRRVDPDGRTIGHFFYDEVAGRLGIEFYIGVYGDLASGGTQLGIDEATLQELERPKAWAIDKIFGIESAYRFGLMKPFPILLFGSSQRAYGHTGSGGSFAYADPDTGIGYAYVMNRNGCSLPTDP